MKTVLWLVPYYITWHYTLGIRNLLGLWRNFVEFVFNFFSIKLLLKTLLAPFQRLEEHYSGGLDLENYFSVLFINILMRIIGFVLRAVVIFAGMVFSVATLIFGAIAFIIWLMLPLILVFILVTSLNAFLKIL